MFHRSVDCGALASVWIHGAKVSLGMKIPVSVIIPVKDEEKNLPDCFAALGDFDDVVVVDSGSTDQTPELVKKFGARYVNFEWNGRFPKKRNWALEHVHLKYTWVLFLDADETLTPEFIEELKLAIERDVDGYWLVYKNFFMGEQIRGDDFRKCALFRRGKGRYEKLEEDHWSHLDMEVHEHLLVDGNVGIIHAAIDHCDDRGLHHYIQKHNDYSTWEARRFLASSLGMSSTFRQKVKRRGLDSWWFAVVVFFYLYVVRAGFLDGKKGLIFALLKMQYYFQIKFKIEACRRETL